MAHWSEALEINRRIELCREDEEQQYRTLVQEIGDGWFAVLVPTAGRLELRLNPGETVACTTYAAGCRYQFTTRVIDRGLLGPQQIPVYRLALPDQVARANLREFVRWPISLDVSYAVLEGEPDPAHLQLIKPRQKAVTVDLSGGGVQLFLREELPVGTMLLLQMEIPPPDARARPAVIRATGEVKRITPADQPGPPRFYAGIGFAGISGHDREIIISYVFRRMVEDRRQER